MGGFFRRVFSPPKAPLPAPAIAAPVTAAKTVAREKRLGEGSGVTGTIMTDTTGLEDEANVSKAVLGGTTKKKKKYA